MLIAARDEDIIKNLLLSSPQRMLFWIQLRPQSGGREKKGKEGRRKSVSAGGGEREIERE